MPTTSRCPAQNRPSPARLPAGFRGPGPRPRAGPRLRPWPQRRPLQAGVWVPESVNRVGC